MCEIDYNQQRDMPSAMLERRTGEPRKKTFKALFCERFECSSLEYESHAFSVGLYRHARPFASLLARWTPEFFEEDTGFIRDLASAASRAEVLTELNRFYGRNVRDRNWVRKVCHLRISGKRIQRLARSLFESDHRTPLATP